MSVGGQRWKREETREQVDEEGQLKGGKLLLPKLTITPTVRASLLSVGGGRRHIMSIHDRVGSGSNVGSDVVGSGSNVGSDVVRLGSDNSPGETGDREYSARQPR